MRFNVWDIPSKVCIWRRISRQNWAQNKKFVVIFGNLQMGDWQNSHLRMMCDPTVVTRVFFIHCLGMFGNRDKCGWWVKAFLNSFIPVECRMLIKTVFASTFRINRCQDPGDGKSLRLRSRIWRKGFPLLYFLLLLHGLFLPQQFHCGSGQPESFCSFGHYALFLLWM